MAFRLPLRPKRLEDRLCRSCQQKANFSKPAPLKPAPWAVHRSVKEQILDPSVGTKRVKTPDGNSSYCVYPDILPYPYGPRLTYKQSNKGLYGGLSVRTGNTVSDNDNKSRTKWKPNIQSKALYSKALGRSIKIRVATRVLRTIDKLGGLDEYILGDKPARIKELGPMGWILRWRLIRTEAVQERFRRQRIALGVPEDGIGDLGLVDLLGRPASAETVQRQVAEVDRQLDEADLLEDSDIADTIDPLDVADHARRAATLEKPDEQAERDEGPFMSEEHDNRNPKHRVTT